MPTSISVSKPNLSAPTNFRVALEAPEDDSQQSLIDVATRSVRIDQDPPALNDYLFELHPIVESKTAFKFKTIDFNGNARKGKVGYITLHLDIPPQIPAAGMTIDFYSVGSDGLPSTKLNGYGSGISYYSGDPNNSVKNGVPSYIFVDTLLESLTEYWLVFTINLSEGEGDYTGPEKISLQTIIGPNATPHAAFVNDVWTFQNDRELLFSIYTPSETAANFYSQRRNGVNAVSEDGVAVGCIAYGKGKALDCQGGSFTVDNSAVTSNRPFLCNNSLVLGAQQTPDTFDSPGKRGEIRWTDDYLYVATGPSEWKRCPLSTF